MTVPTEADHLAAILAALNKGDVLAYGLRELQAMGGDLPDAYIEVNLSWRFGSVPRLSGRNTTDGYRFTTRAVAKNGEWNVHELQRLASDAVRGRRLPIAERESTPVQRESSDPVEYGDGWYSAWTTWTYVI